MNRNEGTAVKTVTRFPGLVLVLAVMLLGCGGAGAGGGDGNGGGGGNGGDDPPPPPGPPAAGAFVTMWQTNAPGDDTASADNQIRVPLASAGTYDVTISGTIEGFGFTDWSGGNTDADKLTDVVQWGAVVLRNDGGVFCNADNLAGFTAADTPDLSTVTDMSYMFTGAAAFNGDIGGWDTSSVNNMSGMFSSAIDKAGSVIELLPWDLQELASRIDIGETNTFTWLNSGPFSSILSSRRLACAHARRICRRCIRQDHQPAHLGGVRTRLANCALLFLLPRRRDR